MPIYAYKCESCGHAKDVLQKISDAPLTVCPSCGAASFKKQITAAGFQLKGSGWYVTDFRGGNTTAAVPPTDAKTEGKAAEGKSESKGDAKPADGAPAKAAAPAPAPAKEAAPSPPAASGSPGTGH